MKQKLESIKGILEVFWQMTKEDFEAIEDKPRVILAFALGVALMFVVYCFVMMPLFSGV